MSVRRQPGSATITLSPDGFSIAKADGPPHCVAWASVQEIFAFKIDLFTCDSLQLGIRVSDDGTYWQVGEDDAGFHKLLAEIERRFGIAHDDWYSDVVFPAFAANRRTLWAKP